METLIHIYEFLVKPTSNLILKYLGVFLLFINILKLYKDNYVFMLYLYNWLNDFKVIVFMASIIMFVNIIRLWLNDYKVLNTDVKFGIAIGNIFKKKGSIVVPINNRFKVDPKNNILTLESILAQTVKKYWNGDVTQLQNDLIKKLQGEEECYPLGKTIKITKDRKTFYFLANSNINENGNVVPVTTEELKKSLSGLWEFVKNNGDKETLLLPMISTGYGRSNNDKLSVFSLIIQSFHSKEVLGNYIDKYTICIRQSDIKRYKLNMSDFREVAYFLNKYKTIFEQ